MIKELLSKLKSAVSAPEPDGALTAADRKAFKAFFAECDALEPGPGRSIDAYVITGEG